MRRPLAFPLLAITLAVLPATALAQNAFTAEPVSVFAGPDESYPVVAQLGPAAPVEVMGCLSDWSWCDVVFDDSRGWVYAPALNYVYQGARVPLYSYAPGLGIPIITFSLGTYWNRYYRGRPWYPRRDYWLHRRLPPHRRPPGPPPRAESRPHAGAPPNAAPRPRGERPGFRGNGQPQPGGRPAGPRPGGDQGARGTPRSGPESRAKQPHVGQGPVGRPGAGAPRGAPPNDRGAREPRGRPEDRPR